MIKVVRRFRVKVSDTAQGVIGSRTRRKTLAMGVITDYFSTQDGKSVERQLVPLCVPLVLSTTVGTAKSQSFTLL